MPDRATDGDMMTSQLHRPRRWRLKKVLTLLVLRAHRAWPPGAPAVCAAWCASPQVGSRALLRLPAAPAILVLVQRVLQLQPEAAAANVLCGHAIDWSPSCAQPPESSHG